MRIIYDISMLGASWRQHQPRGGIFRAVQNVACCLKADSGSELIFSATHNTVESMEYWKHSHLFKGIPFSATGLKRFVGRNKVVFKELLHLENGVRRSESAMPARKSPFEKLRKPMGAAYRAIEKCFDPIRAENLKDADIFHSPFYPIPQQARRTKRMKKFLTIHDLIPILYPSFCQMPGGELDRILNSVGPEDFIFCVSQSTKNDLCDYLKCDPSRVFVTYNAASADLFYPCKDLEKINLVRKKYQIPEGRYFLSLGLLEPRKNINHSIRCFARLVQQERLRDLYFVLVGAEGWKCDNIFKEVEHYDNLKGRILFTGYVPEEDLAPLYSGALAFVYPSFYEGFGLPPLEAMQCGTPVVASNTSSMPEVIGNAGILVAPSDANALCQSLLDVYTDSSLRERMSRQSLAQAKKFSWQKTTQEILSAYRMSVNGG